LGAGWSLTLESGWLTTGICCAIISGSQSNSLGAL
jgi:hypothetical protein